MLRINQFAKEIGVSNHDVIEVMEKRLGISGKSHSSNLAEDQISQLRRIFDARQRGNEEETPLALHKPSTAVKVVKAAPAPVGAPAPVAAPVAAPVPVAPRPAPAVLVKKAEVAPEPPRVEVVSVPASSAAPSEPSKASEAPVAASSDAPAAPQPTRAPEPEPHNFSRLRVSATPAPAPKPQQPARYIQLPPQGPQGRPRPESGAKPVLQRPGQSATHVQRSGQPQPERVVLPMATNTGKGEVRHEPAPQQAPARTSNRMANLPSLSDLQPEQTFTRIKMSDTPPPPPKTQEPARYIQLPAPRPVGGPSRPPLGSRPSGPGGRPSGPGGPNRGPGGPNRGPGGPGRGPGGPPRPGGPGRSPLGGAPTGPVDPNASKGPGRGSQIHGKRKDDKHSRAARQAEELEQRLRQPRSRAQQIATEFIENELGIVMLSEGVTVKELAEKCNRPAKDVVAKLLHRGIFATINQPLDTELAKELAREFGYLADIVSFEEDVQMIAEEAAGVLAGDKVTRPAVVTIMGHVDHGKTSLLDAIRKARVADGEAGGITQAIGAYHVDVKDPNTGDMRQVVFIDTPGHEAFTKMRARGAKVTDIVILVVAADDGVMPQTIEAINHTKAADVPMIVAINKIDKGNADPDRVMQMLLQHSIQVESLGGDVPSVNVSAKAKLGLDQLLEMILLVADLKDLKGVYDAPATGTVLEAKLDRGRGPVATVLVQQGTLKAGEIFVAGATMGRVRAMFDDRGNRVMEATPSTAVQILGFEGLPQAGDTFQVVDNEGKGRQIVTFRQEKLKAAAQMRNRVTLENIFSTLKEGEQKELNLIVKADTQGSVESLIGSLDKLGTEKAKVRIIHSAAGTITKNDVLLAEASNATIIGFSVKAEREAEELAREEGVDIRFHEIIYKVTEEVSAAMVGLLDALEREVIQGHGEVRAVFKVQKNTVAGSYIQDGTAKKAFRVRVKRGTEVIFDGTMKSLRRFKDEVQEVKSGFECGIGMDGFDDLREGDTFEFYSKEKYAQTSL